MRYREYSKSQLEDLTNDLNIRFDIDRLKNSEIKELAKIFSVSYQTMFYRLQSLGILRK